MWVCEIWLWNWLWYKAAVGAESDRWACSIVMSQLQKNLFNVNELTWFPVSLLSQLFVLTDHSLCCSLVSYQSGEEDLELANPMLSLGHRRWILANEKQGRGLGPYMIFFFSSDFKVRILTFFQNSEKKVRILRLKSEFWEKSKNSETKVRTKKKCVDFWLLSWNSDKFKSGPNPLPYIIMKLQLCILRWPDFLY